MNSQSNTVVKRLICDVGKLQLGFIGTLFHMCEIHICLYLYLLCRWYQY